MENLNLEKFKDFEIENAEMNIMSGGSGSRCTCSTNPSWHEVDTQTDFYDDCGDYVGSSCMTRELLTDVVTYESW